TNISGLPEPRPPAGWGYSYLDHSTGYHGAILVLAALVRRRRTGRGCYIDLSQTETGIMLSGTATLEAQVTGKPTARYGNRMPGADWAPQSEIGTWPIEGFPAKFLKMPVESGGLTGRAAPLMGEDNEYVYRQVLGLTPEEIATLKEDWII